MLCFHSVEIEAAIQQNINMIDLKLYTDCINFAAIKHRDQRRLDVEETPYINHPIGTNQLFLSLLLFYWIFFSFENVSFNARNVFQFRQKIK